MGFYHSYNGSMIVELIFFLMISFKNLKKKNVSFFEDFKKKIINPIENSFH